MIIFLVFTALYHVSLNSALGPLINYLPKTIDAEERRLLATEDGQEIEIDPNAPSPENTRNDSTNNSAQEKTLSPETSTSEATEKPSAVPGEPAPPPPIERPASPAPSDVTSLEHPPHKKPSMLAKWLRPDIYNDYATMRRLVPADSRVTYTVQDEDEAYFHPSVTSSTPLLWIPRDPMGLSTREVRETEEVIPITDEGAFLDEKNNIVWDAEDGRPPIYEEEVEY